MSQFRSMFSSHMPSPLPGSFTANGLRPLTSQLGAVVSGRGLFSRRIAVYVASEFYRHRDQSPFWDLLIGQLKAEARERDWEMQLHFSGGREGTSFIENDASGAGNERDLMGVLAIGMQSRTVKWMLERGIAVATFAGSGSPIGVEVDQYEFIRLGVAELARAGAKRPAFFRPMTALRPVPLDDWAHRMMRRTQECWRESLEKHGLEFVPEFFRNLTAEAVLRGEAYPPIERYQAQGERLAREVFLLPGLSRAEMPDGFVCVDDTLTQGLLTKLRTQAPELREELHIATQSNEGSPILWCEENLIRLQVSPREVAWHLCESLEHAHERLISQQGQVLLSPSVVRPL